MGDAERPEKNPSDSCAIIHIDIDSFYAQVHEVQDPPLRSKPLGVKQKQIIVTCNYVARARGVRKLQLFHEAQKACPDLIIVNGENLDTYRAASKRILATIQQVAKELGNFPVERLGLDEFFLDVSQVDEMVLQVLRPTDAIGFVKGDIVEGTDRKRALQLAARLAWMVRRRIREEHGFTASAGIAVNKLLAKTASSIRKPNAQSLLYSGGFQKMVWDKDVRCIPGIGSKARQRLIAEIAGENIGITETVTVGRVLAALPSVEIWQRLFGSENGSLFWGWLHGRDPKPVITDAGATTQISVEDSFQHCRTLEHAAQHLSAIGKAVIRRMDEDEWVHKQWKRIPTKVRLTLRRAKTYTRESSSAAIPGKVLDKRLSDDTRTEALVKELTKILSRMVGGEAFDLSLLNIAFTNFSESQSLTGQSLIGKYLMPPPEAPSLVDEVSVAEGPSGSRTDWTCPECGEIILAWTRSAHERFHRMSGT